MSERKGGAAPTTGGLEGNDRRARCVAFVTKHAPNAADRLTLHVVGEPAIQLGEWGREEWTALLGDQLNEIMLEHHEESGESESKFSATYLDGERPLKTKQFGVRTRHEITTDNAAGLAAMMDGSAKAGSQLAQQTALAMVRMYLQAMQAANSSLVSTIQSLTERLERSDDRASDALDALHEMREKFLALNADEDEKEMTPAQQKFFELAGQALPGIIQKINSKG